MGVGLVTDPTATPFIGISGFPEQTQEPLEIAYTITSAGGGNYVVAWTVPTVLPPFTPPVYTGFEVFVGFSAGTMFKIAATGPTARSVTITPGVSSFFVQVIGRELEGYSVGSAIEQYYTLGAPTLNSVTATGTCTGLVSWSSVNGAIGYGVFMGTTPGGENLTTPVATAGAVATSVTVTGLLPGTTYYFVVAAQGPFGYGTVSNEVSATTAVFQTPETVTLTPGDTTISVAYTNHGQAASYKVGWSTVSGSEVYVNVGTTNPYLITGLTDGTAYFVKVQGVDSCGNVVTSTEHTATPVTPGCAYCQLVQGRAGLVGFWPTDSTYPYTDLGPNPVSLIFGSGGFPTTFYSTQLLGNCDSAVMYVSSGPGGNEAFFPQKVNDALNTNNWSIEYILNSKYSGNDRTSFTCGGQGLIVSVDPFNVNTPSIELQSYINSILDQNSGVKSMTTGTHMVSLTYDGTTCKLYVDGVDAGIDFALTSYSGSGRNVYTAGFVFGGATASPLFDPAYQGIAVYSRTLSATEVANSFSTIQTAAGSCTAVTPTYPAIAWQLVNPTNIFTLSNSNYTATANVSSGSIVNRWAVTSMTNRAVRAYAEFHIDNAGTQTTNDAVGIGESDPQNLQSYYWTVAGSNGRNATGGTYHGGATARPYTTGDYLMVAYDQTTSSIWWGRNGTWYSGSPSAGSGADWTAILPHAGFYLQVQGPAGTFAADNFQVTVRTARSQMQGPIPLGYLCWDGS